ncbi:MAG TPA: AMP-binding protein [Chthoniobacterales bacterium]|jgi:acyl-coenzyme A synthetase/AMP-(fatty) acid ligase/glycosyltransferase involved in cell wall biosynthesis/acyl carrier protein
MSSEQELIRARCFHSAGEFVGFPNQAIDQPLLNRFQNVVAEFPQRMAVKTRDYTLTYAELDRASNRVAQALRELRAENDCPVGLFFANGAPFVVASLGAIKAGTIQVALESAAPLTRTSYLLKHSGAAVLLTDSCNLKRAEALNRRLIINIDELNGDSSDLPVFAANPDQNVAIDYTSGSTGRPKGMIWDQRGLLHIIARHTNVSHICCHDRLVMFRASVRAYLSVLLNGGTFYPVDLGYEHQPDVAEWLKQEEITIYRSAVSTFRSLMNVLSSEDSFPSVRLILLFGEPAYASDLQAYRRHFSDRCVLSTSLGCNEMDDYAYFFVDRQTPIANGVLPAGYPVTDVDILLLDQNGQKANTGELGEIAVRARYKPKGYWREPELNRTAFMADPDGGESLVYRTGDIGRVNDEGYLFHAGRKDFQLKIRGYRVDVGEVESALLGLNGVKNAAAVGWTSATGDTLLIAYCALSDDLPRPSASQLRRSLMGDLPDFMVPTRLIIVDKMPLTASGKIDRRALPAPDGLKAQVDTPFVAPRNALEETLAAIWAEVLGLKMVGVLDNFLDLGGDSLRATQVIARVTTQLEVRPPLRTMLEAHTIEELASVILKSRTESMEEQELEQLLGELDALSEDEARSRLNGKTRGGRDATAELALIVPFHNEDRHLPWLIRSLQEQDVRNVPIVFVDNASTDRSAALLRSCEEVKAGKWLCLEETRIGKIRAMRTGVEFCQERFGARRVGFLDSDSYIGDSAWIRNSLEIVRASGESFGYTYSPISYFGFDNWPGFKRAYLAYSDVLQFIVKKVGWLANGQGFVCSTDALNSYFEQAEITTEVDLRCSLMALLKGQQAFFNPSVLMSSGRRMIANPHTLHAWCFYEREFYSKKDINTGRKLDLKISDRVEDLGPSLIDRFFERRALKIVCRHLMPLAIFNQDLFYFDKIGAALGIDASEEQTVRLRKFRGSEWLLTHRFEDMIRAIEQDNLTIEIAARIQNLMAQRYADQGSAVVSERRDLHLFHSRPRSERPAASGFSSARRRRDSSSNSDSKLVRMRDTDSA